MLSLCLILTATLSVDGSILYCNHEVLFSSKLFFREWHDEHLVPWAHFIPVSLSMKELPAIMRYMTAHEQGKKRAQEIAEAGRDWHGKTLKKEDSTIYLFRLMLELARVMGPIR